MSLDTAQGDSPPLRGLDDLLSYFRGGERATGGLVGLEHEKFMFPRGSTEAVPYPGPQGIGALLAAFGARGWAEYREAPGLPIIAMTRGAATISLEPGGQVELSGSPFATARAAHAENLAHLADLREVAGGLGLIPVALGYRPFGTPAAMPWMPKSRYGLMRETLGQAGSHAHHMMLMTATGQVSLDWRDEADCARKVTAAARISPLLVGLFANSPLVDGRPSGYLSFRSRVWNDVDRSRCGFPPCLVDGSFSYRAYAEWALDAPMLFLRRAGHYLDPHRTFRRFMAEGFEGHPALASDWVDHLSTLFPEVRIKRVLEIRSADGNDAAMTGALVALMRGLLYDDGALEAAGKLLPFTGLDAHLALHHASQRVALAAPVGTRTAREAAAELLAIARAGLARLDPLDVPLLAPLEAIAAEGVTRAHRVLEAFETTKRPADLPGRFQA